MDFASYIVVCAVSVQDTNFNNPETTFELDFKNKNKWTTYKENMKNKVSSLSLMRFNYNQ